MRRTACATSSTVSSSATAIGWTLATYVFPENVAGADRVAQIAAAVDPAQQFTGLTLVNRELARGFLPQFIKGLGIGTAIVMALVIGAFRNWRLSLYAMLPTAIGLLWAAGVLAIAGVELDLFAVFAVVTFVGIGVDYGIHSCTAIRSAATPSARQRSSRR